MICWDRLGFVGHLRRGVFACVFECLSVFACVFEWAYVLYNIVYGQAASVRCKLRVNIGNKKKCRK